MAETLTNDLVIIGAGPGGYAAAFLAADLGLDVLLIDPERLGKGFLVTDWRRTQESRE